MLPVRSSKMLQLLQTSIIIGTHMNAKPMSFLRQIVLGKAEKWRDWKMNQWPKERKVK